MTGQILYTFSFELENQHETNKQTCKNKQTNKQQASKQNKICIVLLRLLIERFILVGSAMFDATLNLVTRVGLP